MSSHGKKRSKKSVAATPCEDPRLRIFDFNEDNEDQNLNFFEESHPRMETTSSEKDGDVSGKVQNMMKNFGAHINKAVVAKTQRMETSTEASFQAGYQKIQETFKAEHELMQMLHNEYGQQFKTLFQQWDSEMQKFKEKQETLTKLTKEQEKLFQQARMVQMQRKKTIVQVHEEFLKNLEDLEKNGDTLLTSTLKGLKESMTVLQKQIMTKTQEQEMANIRNSIQSMLQ
uniref:synaptonemal complex protein 3 n=1 Tax=Jaculus jaculus TaxID=51337 RepID=UPI0003334127|nr:synaptonemal complex protein 3 [Jaculus jaculus]